MTKESPMTNNRQNWDLFGWQATQPLSVAIIGRNQGFPSSFGRISIRALGDPLQHTGSDIAQVDTTISPATRFESDLNIFHGQIELFASVPGGHHINHGTGGTSNSVKSIGTNQVQHQ